MLLILATLDVRAHAAVDLGLSVKWADVNLGSSAPEEFGYYFAWGETKTKNSYTEANYVFLKGESESGEIVCEDIGLDIAGTTYDVAKAMWGGEWRMPTEKEFNELHEKCKWEWTNVHGINGYKITGPNGNYFPTGSRRI